MAYKSLALLTIQYNFLHKVSLLCPYILLCGGTFTIPLYMVIVHSKALGFIITMMFASFMLTCALIQAICYQIPGTVFTLSDEFTKKHLVNSLHLILKSRGSKAEYAEVHYTVQITRKLDAYDTDEKEYIGEKEFCKII